MSSVPMTIDPLEPLLADSTITAIHITEHAIKYEKGGVTHSSDILFQNDDQLRRVIVGIVATAQTELSTAHPIVDGVLTDGTRVHAEYEPLSISLYKSTLVQG